MALLSGAVATTDSDSDNSEGRQRDRQTWSRIESESKSQGVPPSFSVDQRPISPVLSSIATTMGKFGEFPRERGSRTTTLAAVAVLCAVVAKGVVLGGVGSHRSALVQFNPYGVLARTGGDDDYMGALAHTKSDSFPRGVLAHLESNVHQKLAIVSNAALTPDEKRAVFGSLSGLDNGANNVGGSLEAKGIGSDRSWSVRPAKSAAGDVSHICSHTRQYHQESFTIQSSLLTKRKRINHSCV